MKTPFSEMIFPKSGSRRGPISPAPNWSRAIPARQSFSLLDEVTLYGGFDGTETARDQRDWTAHETILSGDLGIAGDVSDNAFTVVYCETRVSAVIDGITVTGGNANGEVPTIKTAIGNGSTAAGVNSSGELTLLHSTVRGNSARIGGGISGRGTLIVESSRIVDNTAQDEDWAAGGGIDCQAYSHISISNSTIAGNSALSDGGGIYVDPDNLRTVLSVTNSTVVDNSAKFGGGIACKMDDPGSTLINSIVAGNEAASGADLHFYGYDFSDFLAIESCVLGGVGSGRASRWEFDRRNARATAGSAVDRYSRRGRVRAVLHTARGQPGR